MFLFSCTETGSIHQSVFFCEIKVKYIYLQFFVWQLHSCVLLSRKTTEWNKQAKGRIEASPLVVFWLKTLCPFYRVCCFCCCFLLTLFDLWHWNSFPTALCRLLMPVEPVCLLKEQVHCQTMAVWWGERLRGWAWRERADLWLVPFQMSWGICCWCKRSHPLYYLWHLHVFP